MGNLHVNGNVKMHLQVKREWKCERCCSANAGAGAVAVCDATIICDSVYHVMLKVHSINMNTSMDIRLIVWYMKAK
jgi:hypothetical protein